MSKKEYSVTLQRPWFEIVFGLAWLIGWFPFFHFKATRKINGKVVKEIKH